MLSFADNTTILTDYQGIVFSPNYPDPYPDDAVYAWIIPAESVKAIKMFFIDFELDNSDGLLVRREIRKDCTRDYIEIYSGSEINSQNIIGRYCNPYFARYSYRRMMIHLPSTSCKKSCS